MSATIEITDSNSQSSIVVALANIGPKGDPGASAYDIAVENGFIGTEQEFSDLMLQAAEGKFDPGTLTYPGISFIGDEDTGFFNSAPNEVTFVAGGVAKFKYNATGLQIDVQDLDVGTVKSVAATAGTGISVTGSPITESGTLVITNTGVTSLAGTTNEIEVSASTGAVTLSLPSTINANTTGNAATVTNGVYTTDTGTVSNTMLAGLISNDKLANDEITINSTPVSLGGSINVGTVTSVSGTAPISSTGGTTPTISIPQATSSTNGYLSSTDWTTFNNKTSNTGTVTSVGGTGTVNGITLSGSITTSGNLSLGGTLSGVDLTTQVTGTLPVANGGTGATTLTGVVIGNGTSAFTVKTNPSGAFVGTTDTQTLSAKRIDPRVVAASGTSGNLTINGDTTDLYKAEGLTGAITFLTPSGTPVDGQRLMIRLEDNGTARAITWTTSAGAFREMGITLPTTTTLGKITYVGCIYNATDSFWDAVATVTQA